MSVARAADRALRRIRVGGVVQGVGFRPFVHRLAERHGLRGWVLNDSAGVLIEAEGAVDALDAFVGALRAEAPPLARIESLRVVEGAPRGHGAFEIRPSRVDPGAYQLVSPDVATCPDCLREVLDPADRRYRYPFTNCTNCGPRFTIIRSLPYDRPRTTMRTFAMCPSCRAEYEDPGDRRFHAQPNACPACGPRVRLVPGRARPALGAGLPAEDGRDALARAAEMLRGGAVVAVKGLGGFQLACDATDARAVAALRERKRRPHKPFALMMATLEEIRDHCAVSAEEERLLTTPQSPIVLLRRREGSPIVEGVAPGNRYLGAMLPYTPLHHVLLRDVGRPLVMTSGNLSEEPIAAENDEALEALGTLADAFLLHDRGIHARYDDSVWFVPVVPTGATGATAALPQPIRRARGYAPAPVKLPFATRPTLACGAEMKNTFCLTRDEYAFLSQHIGDLENAETLEHLERTLALYRELYDVEPELVAVDLHPDYAATRLGRALAASGGLATVAVQHHHAHLASCLADNAWRPERGDVIGVILDGTGYGADGRIWGGEWLVGGYGGYRRAGRLQYLPLPGGDAATRHPWRIAAGYLQALYGAVPGELLGPAAGPDALALIARQVERGLHAPLTSSVGRLFDAVAALLGVRESISYEAQAAIELEMLATRTRGGDGVYPYGLHREGDEWVAGLGPLFDALLKDLRRGVGRDRIARRFHRAVARLATGLAARIAAETGLGTVALSGGCFQNRLLLREVVGGLRAEGLCVLLHRQVPCNDGGLSLGQAAAAQHRPERG